MAAAKLTAIFGTCRRVGRWKVAKRSEALIIFGRCHVDFRDAYADPEDESISLKIMCLFGSATVTLPEGASVQPSSVSVLSSSRFEVDPSGPTADLPPVVLVSTTIFGRCHAATAQEAEELTDPLEDWELKTSDVLPPQAPVEESSSGLADPTPMPQLHQKPSLGAHARLGEMESVWTDAPGEERAAGTIDEASASPDSDDEDADAREVA